jgi:ABC-type nitrate/sulfonate/bicarbonate transport system substrate-binding protein
MIDAFSRRAMLAQFSATAMLALGACGRKVGDSSEPVRVGTAAGGFNLTMSAVMQQQKFMELFDVSPEMLAVADGSKIMAGIYSGSLDLSPLSGFGLVFPAIERGADMKIINAATLRPMLALFSGKPNVRTLKDFEGKVVGVGAIGSLVHQLTVTLLRKYAVDVASIRFVNLGSNTNVFKGVIAGTVDAGVGPAAAVPDADMYKVHAVENGDMSVELPEFTYQGGWTSVRVIEGKRESLVRVLAAYAKLFRFVEQPSARDAFLQARRSVFPGVPEQEHVSEWNFLQKTKPFALDLLITPERIRYMQQINIDFGIQKEMLPFERVADMSLAQEALKLVEAT